MVIDNKFNNGQIVFLITDAEQLERMVTVIQVTADKGIIYQLSCGSQTSWHYDVEIASCKDIAKELNINKYEHK